MGLRFPLKMTAACLVRQVSYSENAPSITALAGPIADQAALRVLLNRVWDVNLTVLSVAMGVQ